MSIDTSNINILWGSLIVEELIRNEVDYFCISPGSRSAPLTSAVARNNKAKHIICFDERSAAFHGLGYGRAKGKPAVLICTSGTAAANYFPAIIEASVDSVPMIILTADRPPELHDSGANQTIDQTKLYGSCVNWDFNLPCPDEKISPQMVLTTIDQAIYQSCRSPRGPVHINCMFREPLAPQNASIELNYLQSVSNLEEINDPFTKYEFSTRIPELSVVKKIANMVNETKSGIVLVGKLESRAEAESVLRFAQRINWPIFPGINSGLRFQLSKNNFIPYYDQIFSFEKLQEKFSPETVLQFGSRIVSKHVLEFIKQAKSKNYIQILSHPFRHDPQHNVTLRIEGDVEEICQSLMNEVSSNPKMPWLEGLVETSNVIESIMDTFVHAEQNVNEIAVARIISQIIPEKNALFLASSMPIRDMDMFASTNGSIIPVASNRGASGIDGTLATATGFAVGNNLPVTLVIGDLAMIHDLNSLLLLRSIKQPVIVILINNNGSGIFSFLPIADFEDIFEEYFGTPHDLTFEKAAEMFGVDYYNPQTNGEFQKIYQEALMNNGSTIIELKTDRKENLNLHKKVQDRIRIALQS